MVFAGEVGEDGLAFADKMLPYFEAMSKAATTHPDENTRILLGLVMHTGNLWELCVRHERWDLEAIFGKDGAIVVETCKAYNYHVRRP